MTTTLRAPSLAERPAPPSAPAVAAKPLQGADGLAARRRPTCALFTVNPAVADYLPLPRGEAVREELVQAFRRGEPLAVLTGEAGTGKSMLAMMAVASLRDDVRHIAYLSSAPATADDVVRHLALAFGMPLAEAAQQPSHRWLLRTFKERSARGESSLLVLDEAQHLGPEAWLELLQWRDRLRRQGLRLQVLAVGLPALVRHLADPFPGGVMAQPPRILRLAPLDGWATREYICVTLRRNGRWGDPALDAAALDMFHRRTGGVLGRIQRLASRCLQTAEIFELSRIDAEVVAQQADELGLPAGAEPPRTACSIGRQAGLSLGTVAAAVAEAPPAAPASAPSPVPAPATALRTRLRRAAQARVAVVVVTLLMGLGLALGLGWLGRSPGAGLQADARPDPAPGMHARPATVAPTPPVAPGPDAFAAADASANAAAPGPLPRARARAPVNPPGAKAQSRPAAADPPRRLLAQSAAASPACSLILTRFSLGEPLSAADRRTLRQQCR